MRWMILGCLVLAAAACARETVEPSSPPVAEDPPVPNSPSATTSEAVTDTRPVVKVLQTEVGDIACYLILEDGRSLYADFSVCDLELAGKTIRYTTETASLMSPECEGDMDCGLTIEEEIVVAVDVVSDDGTSQ